MHVKGPTDVVDRVQHLPRENGQKDGHVRHDDTVRRARQSTSGVKVDDVTQITHPLLDAAVALPCMGGGSGSGDGVIR